MRASGKGEGRGTGWRGGGRIQTVMKVPPKGVYLWIFVLFSQLLPAHVPTSTFSVNQFTRDFYHLP